jgi:SAM-dependent methyltransferase
LPAGLGHGRGNTQADGDPRHATIGGVLDPSIVSHYELGLEESRLFADGAPSLEFVRTLELLDRLLPPPPARVLDVGGGTGVYAVPLSERGYTVDLVDPIKSHVERAAQIARARSIANMTASLGDARDLQQNDGEYDAVLLMGPLYHLTEERDRLLAFREAIRVCRPGAVVIGVGIPRYASLIDGLRRRILDDPTFRAIVLRDLQDGQHRNPDVTTRPEFFTTAFLHLPDELEREAHTAGLSNVELFAIEGPAWILEDPDDFDNQLFAARAIESDRALMSATSHMMVTGTTASADASARPDGPIGA